MNMKTKIITKTGTGKEIELPKLFVSKIREDLAQRFFEIMKQIQPYGPNEQAGKTRSASGNIIRRRHVWKSGYGRGMARIPRKIMWRRGTQFYWVGATVASARGGKKAHAPKPIRHQRELKMNKKEINVAIKSALAATISEKHIISRYSTLEDIKIKTPMVIDDSVLQLKTKDFLKFMEENLKGVEHLLFQKRNIRAGIGTRRGRKYKKNAGALLIIGTEENKKINGMQVRKTNEIEISDLMPLGRLAIYTENAINELKKVGEEKSVNL